MHLNVCFYISLSFRNQQLALGVLEISVIPEFETVSTMENQLLAIAHLQAPRTVSAFAEGARSGTDLVAVVCYFSFRMLSNSDRYFWFHVRCQNRNGESNAEFYCTTDAVARQTELGCFQ